MRAAMNSETQTTSSHCIKFIWGCLFMPQCVNSLSTRGRYMHRWIRPSLVQIFGLSPVRIQAITWTNAGILSIGAFGTNFSESLIEIKHFHFKNCIWKCRLRQWGPFCLGLNVLIRTIGRNFSEILFKIQEFSFKIMHLKMLSVKRRTFGSASVSQG